MRPNNQILTVQQMVAAENALVESGVSVDTLMQRAGRGAAEWVWRIAAGRSVTVLCGPGNNGGDGYVIAESLRGRGLDVRLVAPIEPKTDAARNAASQWPGETRKEPGAVHGGVFVDCLFGSGLSRPLSSDHGAMLDRLSETHAFSIAVDMPSGIESDSGTLLGPMPQYDLTLALGAWKFAHWRMPAMAGMGLRRLVEIGVAPQAGAAGLIERPKLSAPTRDAHKYTRGLLAVVGGAMPGAGLLAAEAAMQSGAGYVKLLANHSHPAAPAGLVIEEIPLAEALSDKRIDAVLVGPGLGRDDAARKRLTCALDRDLPTVLDGDALSLLEPSMLDSRSSPVIATPHEGELGTLRKAFGISEDNKLASARQLAAKAQMAVVAKGPDTIVCMPDGRTGLASDAPSWLAIAGSGDCLAGIIASRLASGCEPFEAACQGVWLHGEAARIAGPAFTADELARATADELARATGAAYAACL